MLLGFIALSGKSQTSLADSVITPQKLKNIVYQLADDSLKGRFWDSDESLKAAQIIAERMDMAGLKKIDGLNGYFQDFRITSKEDTIGKLLRNVVGVLPGLKKSDEIIIFSAHYDHIGTISNIPLYRQLFEKPDTDTIYNGANDNASGIAALLSLAEYFVAKGHQERTIIFIAFTAEESGMYGSQVFVDQIDPSYVTANINLEMLGRKTKSRDHPFLTGEEHSNLKKLLNKCLENESGKNDYFINDPGEDEHLFSRSDNISFAKQGIPAHSIMLTTGADKYYHKVGDEAATLDYDLMAIIVKKIALATGCLVNGEVTPTRIDKRTNFKVDK
jgi:Zn-dependent M28 family amino/carboxypeptidase